jgi:PAS domain-containing protein
MTTIPSILETVQGQQFFATLTRAVADAFQADFAFVGELTDASWTRVAVRSVWAEGAHAENFEYDLAGTPCEHVVGTSTCCVPSDVQSAYPADTLLQDMDCEAYVGVSVSDTNGIPLGLIALLFKRAISPTEEMESSIREFSLRTAAEMVRARAEERIREEERTALSELTAVRPVLVYSGNQLLSVNDAACSMLGLESGDSVMGSPLELIFPGFEFSSLADIQVGERCALQILTEGQKRQVEARIYPVMFQGRKSGMIVLSG